MTDEFTDIREMENHELADELDRLHERLEYVVDEVRFREEHPEHSANRGGDLPDLQHYGEFGNTTIDIFYLTLLLE